MRFGRQIAKKLKKGDILCLFGQLGSGKTVLVKGIAEGLGLKKKEVTSPSFVLIREYPRGKLPLFHFDLYRLDSLCEILPLGIDEYFYDDGVTVVEWADRLRKLSPDEYLKIELSVSSKMKRKLTLSACGRRYQELLGEINEPR